MKNFYAAYCGTTADGKNFAGVMKLTTANNIVNLSSGDNTLTGVNLCGSKAEAEATAQAWNEAYKKNGTAL